MKNKFFMSLAGGLLLLTGCTDLNVDVDSLYTKYPNNDIAVEAKMADVYYQLRGCFGRRYMEAQETYESLFADQAKYNVIMKALADVVYRDSRRAKDTQATV